MKSKREDLMVHVQELSSVSTNFFGRPSKDELVPNGSDYKWYEKILGKIWFLKKWAYSRALERAYNRRLQELYESNSVKLKGPITWDINSFDPNNEKTE